MAKPGLVAAGFLVFRAVNFKFEYLLLQTSYGIQHWTPPKGFVDPGETELETAYRETTEEAGLSKDDLTIIDGFKKVLKYEVKGTQKKVIYWLAQLRVPETPIVLSREHQRYEWLDLESAVSYAGFAETGQMFCEAETFLKSHFEQL